MREERERGTLSNVEPTVGSTPPWAGVTPAPGTQLGNRSYNPVPLPLYVGLRYQITLARSAGEGTASAPGVREGVRG